MNTCIGILITLALSSFYAFIYALCKMAKQSDKRAKQANAQFIADKEMKK